jgi:Ca2+-binding EF-hand superfamily protein
MNFGIQKAVDLAFMKFDRDNSGSLDVNELGAFLTEVFKIAGVGITVSSWQAQILMKLMDKNKDGRIQKN